MLAPAGLVDGNGDPRISGALAASRLCQSAAKWTGRQARSLARRIVGFPLMRAAGGQRRVG